MRFDIVTIFPKIFDSYFGESILKRAIKNRIVEIKIHNLRDFTLNRHRKVDDKPYGGGAGMVLQAEPIVRAVNSIAKKSKKTKVILFSAKGKPFNQKMAGDWAKKCRKLVIISGRYEGIDERAVKILKAEEISIGPYVLTDGDAAAMVVVSAVARLIPGVIKWESLEEESNFNVLIQKEKKHLKGLEYPHYTRPEVLEWKGKKFQVPQVLLSGNHQKIKYWREKHEK